MRFNIAALFALVATTQLATAAPAPAPEPKWNDKGPEAGYKFGAVACAAGALVCNSQGYTVGAYTLGSGAFCCSTAAAAVTASQSPGWVAAWVKAANKLGDAARVIGGVYAKVGPFVAKCTATVCTMVTGRNPINNLPGLPTRSIDGPLSAEEKYLIERFALPETEFEEDDALLARYEGFEPEEDDLN